MSLFRLNEEYSEEKFYKDMKKLDKARKLNDGEGKNFIMKKIHDWKNFGHNTIEKRKNGKDLNSKIRYGLGKGLYNLTSLVDKDPTEQDINKKQFRMMNKFFDD